MKSIFASNEKRVLGIEVLSEMEMLNVRGGTGNDPEEPERPVTESVDEYDEEDD